MSPHSTRAVASLSALEQYRISRNGFLPPASPLERLSSKRYQPWEDIMNELPQLLESDRLREKVDALDLLSTSDLDSEAEWQRAYSLLSFMTHGYIWGGQSPSERLPPALAIPFMEISKKFDLPPVATYAALNLWNWRPTAPGVDISVPENLICPHTFTGTDDEAWFYLISVAMEARAAPILIQMLDAVHASNADEAEKVIVALKDLAPRLDQIGALLERMDERCNPQVFYHCIRPYLAGSKNMAPAGLPNGVFYDEGQGNGEWRTYGGGSNAQSSLIQFFDVVLGVEHHGSKKLAGFHQEMRAHMPGPHAAFLEEVGQIGSIRNYVEEHRSNAELLDAFNAAVEALTQFRNKHIQLVTRYIIIPSRSPNPKYQTKKMNIAVASSKLPMNGVEKGELHGTGGTKLIPFLTKTRDETSLAAVA